MASNETIVLHFIVTYPMPGPQDVGEQVLPNLRKQFDHRLDFVGYFPVYSDILKASRSPSASSSRSRRFLKELSNPSPSGNTESKLAKVARLAGQMRRGHETKKTKLYRSRYRGTARADHECRLS